MTVTSGALAIGAIGPNITAIAHANGVSPDQIAKMVPGLSWFLGASLAGTSGVLRHRLTEFMIRSKKDFWDGLRDFALQHPTTTGALFVSLLAVELPNAAFIVEQATRSSDSTGQVVQFERSTDTAFEVITREYGSGIRQVVEQFRSVFATLADEEKKGSGITGKESCGPMCRALEAVASGTLSPEAIAKLTPTSDKTAWVKEVRTRLDSHIGFLHQIETDLTNTVNREIATAKASTMAEIIALREQHASMAPEALTQASDTILRNLHDRIGQIKARHEKRVAEATTRVREIVLSLYGPASDSGAFRGFDRKRLESFVVSVPPVDTPPIQGVEGYVPKNTLQLFSEIFSKDIASAGGISLMVIAWFMTLGFGQPWAMKRVEGALGISEEKRQALLRPLADRYDDICARLAANISECLGTEASSLGGSSMIEGIKAHLGTSDIQGTSHTLTLERLLSAFVDLEDLFASRERQEALVRALVSEEIMAVVTMQDILDRTKTLCEDPSRVSVSELQTQLDRISGTSTQLDIHARVHQASLISRSMGVYTVLSNYVRARRIADEHIALRMDIARAGGIHPKHAKELDAMLVNIADQRQLLAPLPETASTDGTSDIWL